VPPGKLGEECGDGDSCEDGLFCRPLEDWGKSGAKVCTRACCDSSECGLSKTGAVCMPSKLGGGLCLGLEFSGRGSAVGTVAQGVSCKQGESENPELCRSGWCVAGVCQDLCCGACTTGVCGHRNNISGSNLYGFACGPQIGGQDAGVPNKCGLLEPLGSPKHSDCKSGACGLSYKSLDPGVGPYLFCSQSCKTDNECTSLEKTLVDKFYCDYQLINGVNARVCVSNDVSNKAPACASDADCSTKKCREVSGVLRCVP
jgi:hypothetical protein